MTRPGSGKRRGIAFGGGGEWFVAWTLSFLTAAKCHGVDFATADAAESAPRAPTRTCLPGPSEQ